MERISEKDADDRVVTYDACEVHRDQITDTDVTDLRTLRIDLSERRDWSEDNKSREELLDDLFTQGESYSCIVRGKFGEDIDSRKGIIAMGQLIFDTKKEEGFVENIVVHLSMRGHGLGRKIMENIIETARNKGLQTLKLTSNPSRTVAHALYKSLGFEIVGEEQKYDDNGNPTYKTCKFELSLID